MAAVSLSPTPATLSTTSMSNRRAPLTANLNAANSPLRGATAALAAHAAKQQQQLHLHQHQKRSYATSQREEPYGNPPPAKKQMLDMAAGAVNQSQRTLKSPLQQRVAALSKSQQHAAAQARRTASTYEARLAKERAATRQQAHAHHQQQQQQQQQQQAQEQADSRVAEKNLENLRQWQKQYRTRFPKFVFYFESIPDELRIRLVKQAMALGAREEKFFSNQITHVVTSRPIPPEQPSQQQGGEGEDEDAASQQENQPQTINPSLLLHRGVAAEATVTTGRSLLSKPSLIHQQSGRVSLAAALAASAMDDNTTMLAKRPKMMVKGNNRNAADVLVRARAMNKKIWSHDKLQRVMSMLLDADTAVPAYYNSATSATVAGYGAGSGSTGAAGVPGASRASEEPSNLGLLQTLLHKERVNGPSDRDPTVGTRELCLFRGPYIYVYDIDEKMKPIMVREYNRVPNKTDGEWPQFRTVSGGRCPFIEEVDVAEKQQTRVKERVVKPVAAPVEKPTETVTRSAATKPATGKRTLAEMQDGHNRGAASTTSANATSSFKLADRQQQSGKKSPAKATATVVQSRRVDDPFRMLQHAPSQQNAFTSRAAAAASTRLFAGEPVASGLQASNITSAIRSQMVSSASGVASSKAGTSKEVHGLQRKVLQKNSAGSATGAHPQHALLRETSTSTSTSAANSTSSAKSGATLATTATASTSALRGKLEVIREEGVRGQQLQTREAAGRVARRQQLQVAIQHQQQQMAAPPPPARKKKDLKPGYCENCQDKFDDFDDHIVSKKHRRFADDANNWLELDNLLGQLERPLKYSPHDFEGEY